MAVIDKSGTIAHEWQLADTVVKVEPEWVDTAIARLSVQVARSRFFDDLPNDRIRRQVRRELYVPSAVPAVTAAIVSRGHQIWLKRSILGEAHATWRRMSFDGSQYGDVQLPTGAIPFDADQYGLWAIVSDLESFRLVRYTDEGLPCRGN
jgi:hypothetical protein